MDHISLKLQIILIPDEEHRHILIELNNGNAIGRSDKGVHTPEGILIVHGEGIKEDHQIQEANIADIASTVLHILGEPVPEDMDGKVLKEIFREDSPLYKKPVEYQKPKKHKPAETKQYSAEEEKAVKQRLKDLGYL